MLSHPAIHGRCHLSRRRQKTSGKITGTGGSKQPVMMTGAHYGLCLKVTFSLTIRGRCHFSRPLTPMCQ